MRLHTFVARGASALASIGSSELIATAAICLTGAPAFATTPPSTDVAKLEATVKAYESELAALHSHEALETLQAAYGYYFDKGQWRQVASLFATNATFEFG
jgi:hypothetical protein